MRGKKAFKFAFVLSVAVLTSALMACGDSKYSGKWYCDYNTYFDVNMSKKTIATYNRRSDSSMPMAVSDIKILSETSRGVLFEVVNTGAQIRIEDGKMVIPGLFSSAICTRDPDAHLNKR